MSNQNPGINVFLKDGTPFKVYEPSDKQYEFHTNTTPRLVAIGNRGGGKSLMLRMDAHMRCLSAPGINAILIRKTLKDLMKSHINFQGLPWGTLKQEMELLGGSFNATDKICFYPNGSKLFLSYVGHEGDALNLLSAEFAAAYFDEISVIPWDFVTQLIASVRVPKNSGLTAVVRAATNPLGPSTPEIYKYFINKDVEPEEDQDYNPEDWGHIKIGMDDNPYLDVDQYKRQFAGLPEHVKAAWLHGEYMESNTLFNFMPTREGKPWHVIKELNIDELVKKATIYRAYDHGYAPDPAYCCWIAHLGNRYIVFHEQTWLRTVVSDIAADIKAIDKELGIERVGTTFCDPSIDVHTGADVKTIKDIFESNGVPMECSVNNREHFASVVHTALAEEAGPDLPRLQILRWHGPITRVGLPNPIGAGAPYMVKAIPQQRWDEKHPLRLADQANDHPVVSLAYFLFSHSSEEQRPITSRTVPKWMRPKRGADGRWVLGKHNVRGY